MASFQNQGHKARVEPKERPEEAGTGQQVRNSFSSYFDRIRSIATKYGESLMGVAWNLKFQAEVYKFGVNGMLCALLLSCAPSFSDPNKAPRKKAVLPVTTTSYGNK